MVPSIFYGTTHLWASRTLAPLKLHPEISRTGLILHEEQMVFMLIGEAATRACALATRASIFTFTARETLLSIGSGKHWLQQPESLETFLVLLYLKSNCMIVGSSWTVLVSCAPEKGRYKMSAAWLAGAASDFRCEYPSYMFSFVYVLDQDPRVASACQ